MSEEGRRVWVLTQSYPYEGEILFGVYTTREIAGSALDLARPLDTEWCIYEVTLDAIPRPFMWNDREENKEETE